MELKINKVLEEIVPKLREEEFESLKDSIKIEGQLKPIDVMSDGTIVDGHHRFKACKDLGIQPSYSEMPNIKTIEEAVQYSYNINFPRRSLNPYQKVEWTKDVYVMIHNVKNKQGAEYAEDGLRKMAEKARLSLQTFDRGTKIMNEANEEVKEKLRSGEWTVNYAYNGYNAIGKAPEDKQAVLREQFEKEELTAPLITKLIEESQKAVELLGNTSEKIQKEFEEKYKDEFWTADLKFKDLLKEVSIAEGNPADCIQREIEQSLMTKDEVSKMAKKVGGYFVGESHYWVIMVDPLLFKEPKKKKIEEDEEE